MYRQKQLDFFFHPPINFRFQDLFNQTLNKYDSHYERYNGMNRIPFYFIQYVGKTCNKIRTVIKGVIIDNIFIIISNIQSNIDM